MSALSKKIAPKGVPIPRRPGAPGPRNSCWPLYGAGDLDDWQAVDSLRESRDWRAVQEHIDGLLGIATHLPLEMFRRHWRRRCDCWPRDLKL